MVCVAAVSFLSLGSCKKMPDGQGELVVVMYNSDGWTSLDVFPYTPEYVPGMEPIDHVYIECRELFCLLRQQI